MSDAPQSDGKKIIIDEDWKSQVEAEKQAAQQQQATQQQEAAPATETADRELPPPDLLFLASTLYLQAMVSLGLLPNPMSNAPKMHLPQAKHAIDTLQVLFDKTEGNRTPEETAATDAMLHELRMAFLAVTEKKQG
jgi:hypothetical protein